MESIYLTHDNAKKLQEAVNSVSNKYGYTPCGVNFCKPGANNVEIKFESDLSARYLFHLFNEYAELRLKPNLITLGELAERGEIS